MDVETMRAHCVAKPGAWADNPWAHEHPVFKVGEGERGKIFAFLSGDRIGIKGGPSREAADESYRLVSKLPKKLRPEGWEA